MTAGDAPLIVMATGVLSLLALLLGIDLTTPAPAPRLSLDNPRTDEDETPLGSP